MKVAVYLIACAIGAACVIWWRIHERETWIYYTAYVVLIIGMLGAFLFR